MKNINQKAIVAVLCSLIISFSSYSQNTELIHSTNGKTNNPSVDEKYVSFGDIKIYLPEIDNMTECYSTPIVKSRADKFEYKENIVLAFYLNNATYKHVDRLNEIDIDDYFKIFSSNQLKGVKVGQAELNKMASLVERSYTKEEWAELKKKIEITPDNISLERPALLESYVPNSKTRSFIMLIKNKVDEKEIIIISALNIMEIKERLIYTAYYKSFTGEQSLKDAKAKNNNIALQFINKNK